MVDVAFSRPVQSVYRENPRKIPKKMLKFQGNPDNSRKSGSLIKIQSQKNPRKIPLHHLLLSSEELWSGFLRKFRDKILLILLNFWEFCCNFVRISPQDFPWNFMGISWEIFFHSIS